MESVVIIAPREYNHEIETRLSTLFTVHHTSPTNWVVESGVSRAYVSRDDDILNEIENDALCHICSLIEKPVLYSVDFSDIELCRAIMFTVADDPALLVDNDHGIILAGPDFIDLIRRHANWDWRCEPPP
ncbi:MAG: hypothetical protein HYV63_31680 [Candidatus Schekmanbacteria bacterium]|nr:hypothetical protein [Candidatus Schekmanbacteria bacterium]